MKLSDFDIVLKVRNSSTLQMERERAGKYEREVKRCGEGPQRMQRTPNAKDERQRPKSTANSSLERSKDLNAPREESEMARRKKMDLHPKRYVSDTAKTKKPRQKA